MKIGIYSELYEGSALGGREYIVAVLAEEMAARGHEVYFLHHQCELTAETFAAQLGISARGVGLRWLGTRPPARFRGFRASRAKREAWDRNLSEPYELFINIVHGNPALCYSARGVLMVLFPFFEPFNIWSGRQVAGAGRSRLWVLARHLHLRFQWKRCMESYALKTSISHYSQFWTRRRWKVESTVIYPPTDSTCAVAPKTDSILSIGRFSGYRVAGLRKRQLEMMRSFLELDDPDWQYASVGAVGKWAQDRSYFQEVQEVAAAANPRARAVANIPRAELKSLLQKAKIFWHAAGFGDDDEKHPELMEHFGIATVDAMAAGCVPVVIRKGAQPEIVEHGVSGFLWENLEELKSYTCRLINDDALRARMAGAARERATRFSREAFLQRFAQFLRPFFNGNTSLKLPL